MSKRIKCSLAVLLAFAMVISTVPQGTSAAASETVTVSTQEELDEALKDGSNIRILEINSDKKQIVIPTNILPNLTITVYMPVGEIINGAEVKKLKVKSAKTLNEKASGNNIDISDDRLTLKIAKNAEVGTVNVTSENANIKVTNNGSVNTLSVKGGNADIKLTNNGELNKLNVRGNDANVEYTNNGATGTVSIKCDGTNVNAENNGYLNKAGIRGDGSSLGLNNNAEVGTVNARSKSSDVNITNNAELKIVNIYKGTSIAINGTTSTVTDVNVKPAAEGASIETATPVKLQAAAEVNVTLKKGAGLSTVTLTSEDAGVKLVNETAAKIAVTDSEGNTTKIAGGKTASVGKTEILDELAAYEEKSEAKTGEKAEEEQKPASTAESETKIYLPIISEEKVAEEAKQETKEEEKQETKEEEKQETEEEEKQETEKEEKQETEEETGQKTEEEQPEIPSGSQITTETEAVSLGAIGIGNISYGNIACNKTTTYTDGQKTMAEYRSKDSNELLVEEKYTYNETTRVSTITYNLPNNGVVTVITTYDTATSRPLSKTADITFGAETMTMSDTYTYDDNICTDTCIYFEGGIRHATIKDYETDATGSLIGKTVCVKEITYEGTSDIETKRLEWYFTDANNLVVNTFEKNGDGSIIEESRTFDSTVTEYSANLLDDRTHLVELIRVFKDAETETIASTYSEEYTAEQITFIETTYDETGRYKVDEVKTVKTRTAAPTIVEDKHIVYSYTGEGYNKDLSYKTAYNADGVALYREYADGRRGEFRPADGGTRENIYNAKGEYIGYCLYDMDGKLTYSSDGKS